MTIHFIQKSIKSIKINKLKIKRKTRKLRKTKKKLYNKLSKKIRKQKKSKTTQKKRGGALYKPDEIFTIDQFYNEPNFPDAPEGSKNCIDILVEKNSPLLPTSISFSGKFTGEKYNKCKKSMQMFNLLRLNRTDYLKYREIIKRFNERNQLYIEQQKQGKTKNITLLGKEKKIEDLGNIHILQYVVDLFYQMPKRNTEELGKLLKIINPNWYHYIMDPKNYMNMKWMQCTAKCTIIKQNPSAVNEMIDWIYETNKEVWKMNTPQDLINLLEGYYSIQKIYNAKYEDIYIENVMINESSKGRYKDLSVCWDVTFHLVNANFKYLYGPNDDDPASNANFLTIYRDLYIDSFTRHYPTYIFKNKNDVANNMNIEPGKITQRFNDFVKTLINIDPNATMDSIKYEDFRKENGAYDDEVISFDSITDNFYVKRIFRILGIFMESVTFPGLFYDLHTFNRYSVFYPYYDKLEMAQQSFCNDGVKIIANTDIFQSDTNIEEIVHNFFNKYLYGYDYDALTQKKKDNEYPRLRIIDVDKQKGISVQVNSVLVGENIVIGRCITITTVDNIFDRDINNIKISSECLLIWEDIKHNEASLDSCPVLYNGMIKPILNK